MEKENNSNTNMTVGVVLTVAVAIMVLVAMIPAMMPAGEDGGETPYVTSVEIADGGSSFTMKYNDTPLATVNMNTDYNWKLNYTGTLQGYSITDGYYGYTTVTGDSSIAGSFDTMSLNFNVHSVADFSETAIFQNKGNESPAILSYTMAPGAPSNTPDIYTLVWETCFLTTPYDPGVEPEDPSGGGVDTNTVLIGAIITLMFISIALVAVRSFRA